MGTFRKFVNFNSIQSWHLTIYLCFQVSSVALGFYRLIGADTSMIYALDKLVTYCRGPIYVIYEHAFRQIVSLTIYTVLKLDHCLQISPKAIERTYPKQN
jgi:hypothetical protein